MLDLNADSLNAQAFERLFRVRERYARQIMAGLDDLQADIAKPLKGFGSGIFEVALRYRTDAYRTAYSVQLEERVWVLHAFQKKAKQGIKTPKQDIGLICERLKRLKKELQQ